MKKIALIILAAMVLASCITRSPELPHATIEPAPPTVTSTLVPMPPTIKSIDWQASLFPMVQQMLTVEGINNGSVLLVNTLKNATNGSVQTGKATTELTRLIARGSSKFHVVSAEKLNAARQTLALFADDSLESRSKAVGIARYLNAQYVLYSAAKGDVKEPTLDLQLMLVQTGEIIWSGEGIARN
ncbi:MAG: penicillin-binding protein activator LpoB [Sodalis sp. (in: enterobacteria)]